MTWRFDDGAWFIALQKQPASRPHDRSAKAVDVLGPSRAEPGRPDPQGPRESALPSFARFEDTSPLDPLRNNTLHEPRAGTTGNRPEIDVDE